MTFVWKNNLETQASELVRSMNERGYGVISDVVSPADLDRMQAFVSAAVTENSARGYVGFTGSEAVSGSGLDEIAQSSDLSRIVQLVYESGTGQAAPQEPFYQVLRCLVGNGARQHSWIFHYDSYVVTVLMPIIIPLSGQTGDLLMLPNTRPIRSSYWRNLIDKLVLDNKLAQALLKITTLLGVLRPVRVKMTPGNAYFFWGYRSIHTNEPCDADNVRATALFHYHNPHEAAAKVFKSRLRLKRGHRA